jgi:hypothetical protein
LNNGYDCRASRFTATTTGTEHTQKVGTNPKKSEMLNAYKLALMGEKAIQKIRKDLGDKLPEVFVSLESLVLEVKTELEARGIK